MKVGNSQEPTLRPVTNKTLYKEPRRGTNAPGCRSMAPLSATKQTRAPIPGGRYEKNAAFRIQAEPVLSVFRETKGGSVLNMNYRILPQ